MLAEMTLDTKLRFAFVSVSLIPFIFLGVLSFDKASQPLSEQFFIQLKNMREVNSWLPHFVGITIRIPVMNGLKSARYAGTPCPQEKQYER